MKIDRSFLLLASFPLTLALIFSCSSDGGGGGGGGGGSTPKSGLYVGCNIGGSCQPMPSAEADNTCQAIGGVIDNSCTFVNCKISGGACTPLSAELCQAASGEVVSECGSPNPPPGGGNNNNQYCYDENEEACGIIGTDEWCVQDAAKCREYGGVVHNYSWCVTKVGVSNIFTCED
jgi:hypothetical protein